MDREILMKILLNSNQIKETLVDKDSYFLIDLVYKEVRNTNYFNNDNIFKKYSFYKGNAKNINIDIDVSFYSVLSYLLAYKGIYKDYIIKKQIGCAHKYELANSQSSDYVIRGDTMINVLEILKLCGIDKLDKLEEDNKINNDIKSLIEKVIRLCYDFGNFFPIPYDNVEENSLNTKKECWCKETIKINGKSVVIRDSFYIFLVNIYNYYCKRDNDSDDMIDVQDTKYSDLLTTCYEDWLNKFNSWNDFVGKNYLKPFCKNKKPQKLLKDDIKIEDYLNTIIDILEKRRDMIKKSLKSQLQF